MLTETHPKKAVVRKAFRRVKLTARVVQAAVAADRDVHLWDSEVLGFGLKVSVAGRRTYVLRYRLGRRQRIYCIGPHGSPWTPETAREEAKILLGRVAARVDPQDDKVAFRKAWTVAELCEAYAAEGMATRKASSVETALAEIRNHIVPLLGSRPAASVECEDIERLMLEIASGATSRRRKTRKQGLSRVRGGKGAANSALMVLRAAFNFAIRRKLRFDNPTMGVRRFPEQKLGRFLAPAELARLGQALSAAEALGVESWQAIAALRLLLLTGCRRNEILGLRRRYVDAHNSCLRLPDSKTGAKIVHVGPVVIALLEALPQVGEEDWVLPAERGEGHFVNLQKPWTRIRAAAGLGDLRIHDLRHGFASLGAAGGDSLLVIGALLGHRSAKTTERYAHLSDHPLKDAAGRISGEAARLLGLTLSPGKAVHRRADPSPAPPGSGGLLGAVVETRWVDTPAAAAFLGHTVGTLQTYRWMGTGPRFRRIGRRIVYAQGDLEAWRAEHPAPPRPAGPPPSGPNIVLLSQRRVATP